MVGKPNWKFEDYMYELIYLAETQECVPDVKERRDALLDEVWQFFPQECVEAGVVEA